MLMYDISLASKLTSLSIKVESPEEFSLFKYGLTSKNFVNLFLEIPLVRIVRILYSFDPYFLHSTRLLQKKELIKDGELRPPPKRPI